MSEQPKSTSRYSPLIGRLLHHGSVHSDAAVRDVCQKAAAALAEIRSERGPSAAQETIDDLREQLAEAMIQQQRDAGAINELTGRLAVSTSGLNENALLPGLRWAKNYFDDAYEKEAGMGETLDNFERLIADVETRSVRQERPNEG